MEAHRWDWKQLNFQVDFSLFRHKHCICPTYVKSRLFPSSQEHQLPLLSVGYVDYVTYISYVGYVIACTQ